jgi:hypothetical protein
MSETQPSESAKPATTPAPADAAQNASGEPNDGEGAKAAPGSNGTGDATEAKGGATEEASPNVVLLAKGNPLRPLRGGVTAGIASLLALILMAESGQLRWGVPLGTICILVAAWGLMDLLGTFDDADDTVAASSTFEAVRGPLAAFLGLGVLF